MNYRQVKKYTDLAVLVLPGGSSSAIIAEPEPVEGVAVSAASTFDYGR